MITGLECVGKEIQGNPVILPDMQGDIDGFEDFYYGSRSLASASETGHGAGGSVSQSEWRYVCGARRLDLLLFGQIFPFSPISYVRELGPGEVTIETVLHLVVLGQAEEDVVPHAHLFLNCTQRFVNTGACSQLQLGSRAGTTGKYIHFKRDHHHKK